MPAFRSAFSSRLAALGGFPDVDARDVSTLADALAKLDDGALLRINPWTLAEEAGLDPAAALDLCVVGAKVGLFDLGFHLICPGCGAIESSHGSWNGLAKETMWCHVCRIEVPIALDDQVEVSFALSGAVAEIDFDPYASPWNYARSFFSASYERSQTQMALVEKVQRGFLAVRPEQSEELALVAEPGARYRAVSIDAHAALDIIVDESAAATDHIDVEIVPGGFAPTTMRVRPGAHTVRVRSSIAGPSGLLFVEDRVEDFTAARLSDPPRMRPYVSAKNLLNHQRFRDLFKAEALDPKLRLHLRSLTLLFTDLKGSTALYDATGDVTAYGVVQEHFQVLMTAVRRHHGAVVKTMGDAVMATFSAPEEAVAAADEMLGAMARVNDRVQQLGQQTGLKVGIHEGAALAVVADDRLDYFGQTVNIAARVQALADAGEIWVTDAVMKSAPAAALLKERGWSKEPRRVSLKGVGQPTDVFRMAR
jgi:class 3 adenylate cyclase